MPEKNRSSSCSNQERLKAECSGQFSELAARVSRVKSDWRILRDHLRWYKEKERELSMDTASLRLSPTMPGILIRATDDASQLRKVERTLANLDSKRMRIITAMSTMEAYFNHLNGFEREADEICGRFKGKSVNGLHKIYPCSHRAAILYWTRTVKNEILMEVRSCW